jgi:3-oxo-5-alpha-steroid 4-dehydrogenase 1
VTEAALLRQFILLWSTLGVLVAGLLTFVSAPYGRHARPGWGPAIGSMPGWILMELPAPVLFAVLFLRGSRSHELASIAFLACWELHYLNRAFLFPLRRPGRPTPLPLLIAAQGFLFNLVNAYTCGRWLFAVGPPHPDAWLADPRFLAGLALFVTGFLVNVRSDEILFRLRGPGDSAYRVPFGGLFRWVSAPNYLGELLEWWGFALATWSLAPLGFAVWTTANLLPRALSNHRWYRQRFLDYPRERKALIPYVL